VHADSDIMSLSLIIDAMLSDVKHQKPETRHYVQRLVRPVVDHDQFYGYIAV